MLKNYNLVGLLLILSFVLTGCPQSRQEMPPDVQPPKTEPPKGPPPRKKYVPIFGARKPIGNPITPEASRLPKDRIVQPKPKPANYANWNQQMRTCADRYKVQWGNTKVILNQVLGAADVSCWDGPGKAEIQKLEQDLDRELVQVEQKLNKPGSLPNAEIEQNFEALKNLGLAYHQMQEHLSFCRLHEVVTSNPAIAPDTKIPFDPRNSSDSLLGHAIGEPFILDSGLEGTSQQDFFKSTYLDKRLKIYRKLDAALTAHKYIKDSFQSDPCQGLPDAFHVQDEGIATVVPDFIKEYREYLIEQAETAIAVMASLSISNTGFYNTVKDTIDQKLKKAGDAFFFVGGTIQHAVIFQVLREAGGTYSFRIYNSGDGLAFHASVIDGTKQTHSPLVDRIQIPYDKITGFTFWKVLRDLMVQNSFGTYNSQTNYFYTGALALLGDKQTVAGTGIDRYLDPQIAGICGYFVIPYFNQVVTDNKTVSSHLEFMIRTKILDDYMRLNFLRMREAPISAKLAQKSLIFFSEEIAKNLEGYQNYIDRGMASLVSRYLEDYRQFLADSENAASAKFRRDTYDLARKNKEVAVPVIITGAIKPNDFNQGAQGANVVLIETENWRPQVKTLAHDLADFNGKLSYYYPQVGKNPLLIQNIVKKIPVDNPGFWNGLTLDESKALISEIRDLSTKYVKSLSVLTGYATADRGLTPGEVLAQIKLLTIADLLMENVRKQEPNGFYKDFPPMYLKFFDYLFLGEQNFRVSSLLTIKDKDWTPSYLEMKKYWSGKHISPTFFAFERYPVHQGDGKWQSFRVICKSASDCNNLDYYWSAQYANPDKNDWPDFAWIKSKFISGFLQLQPQPSHSFVAQILKSLSAGSPYQNGILKPFFDIREIAYITHLMNFGSISRGNIKTDSYSSPLYVGIYLQPKVEDDAKEKYYLNSVWNNIDGSSFSSILNGTLVGAEKYGYIAKPADALLQNQEFLKLENLKSVLTGEYIYQHEGINTFVPYQIKNTTSSIVAQTNTQESKLTLEMYRRVLNFDSITNTLAFFREHPGYLRQKKWQILFKNFVFQPERLEKEFYKTHNLPQILTKFCSDNYKKNKDDQDFISAAFFVRMNQLFFEFYREQEDQNKRHPIFTQKIKFMDSRKAFYDLVGRLSPDLGESRGFKNLFFRDILRTYLHDRFADPALAAQWRPWDLSTFFIAQIYRIRYPLEGIEDYETEDESAIQGLAESKLPGIVEYLKKANPGVRDDILNRIVQFFSRQADRSWKPVSDTFWEGELAGGDKLNIDLTIPKIYIAGKSSVELPFSILSDPDFKKLVDFDATEDPLEISAGLYEIWDRDGRRVRVSLNGGTLLVQKKFGTQWYQWVKESEISSIDTDNWWKYVPGYINWVSVVDAYSWGAVAEVNNRNQSPPYPGWKALGYDAEVLAYDKKTKKLFAVGRNNPAAKGAQFTKMDKNGALSQLVLTSSKDSPVEFLNRFEHPVFIWVWKNQNTHEIDHIELPRFGLTFQVSGTGLLVSKELESFVLSRNQSFQEWEHYPYYLVLEKDQEKRLIFPKFRFEKSRQGLLPGFPLMYDFANYELKQQRYLSYTVDPFHQKLIAPNAESEYFLSYIHLRNHQNEKDSYEKARMLLYGQKSDLGPYNRYEVQTLDWLIAGENLDQDPRAIALRLGAEALKVKNFLNNHTPLEPSKKFVEYDQFLKTRDKVSTRWLPEDLERFFLNHLMSEKQYASLPQLVNRWKELNGDMSPSEAMFKQGINTQQDFFAYGIDGYNLQNQLWNLRHGGSVNILQGGQIKSHLKEFYELALEFPNPNEARLRALIQQVSDLDPAVVTAASLDKLKKEYLSYLEAIIRIGQEGASQYFAKMVYAMANSKDKSFIPRYSFVESLIAQPNQKWEDVYPILRQYSNIPKPALAPSNPQLVSGQKAMSQESHFWDPKANPSYSKQFKYEYQVDNRLKPYSLEEPILSPDAMKQYIKEEDLPAASKQELADIANDLGTIFKRPPREPEAFVDEYLGKIAAQVRKYTEDQVKKRKNYSLVNPAEFKKLETDLTGKKNAAYQLSKDIETKIVRTLKKLPADKIEKLKKEILLESAIDRNPTLESVLHFYANKNFKDLFDSNSTLTQKEIETLLDDITAYLLVSTYYFKISKVITGIGEVLAAEADPTQTMKAKQEVYRSFYTAATQTRAYKTEKYPDILVFEYFMRVLVRQDQITGFENLNITDKLKSDPKTRGSILEMIMGSGKTFFLLPMLSHLNAQADQLSIIILPETLLPSMIRQINEQLSRVFGQGVDRLTIRRHDKYNVEKLTHLYRRLKDDLFSKRVVVTSNSSIQSLFLIFAEKLYDFENQKDQKTAGLELEVLQDIFWLLRNYGYVTIDEIDLVMDIMKSHRFSLGAAGRIERDVVDTAFGLYKFMSLNRAIQSKLKIPFFDQTDPNAKSFSKAFYDKEVKPLIIDELMAENRLGQLFFTEDTYIKQLNQFDRAKLTQYLKSKNTTEMEKILSELKDPRLKNVVSVLYSEIHQILPLSLSKLYLTHYGIFPKSECKPNQFCPDQISIPYQSGTPVVLSRFGSDLEALNYTIQTHLEAKDSYELLKREHVQLVKNFRAKKSQAVLERAEKFFGKLPVTDFLTLNENRIRAAAQMVNKRPDLILELVHSQSVPQIHVFPNQLQTTSHIYPILFKVIQGVTGTVWNASSFPAFYQEIVESDTMGRTLTGLWSNVDSRQVRIIPGSVKKDTKDLVEAVIKGTDASSIIDLGGLFRGKNHEAVARIMAADPDNIRKGISNLIFYDEQHETQVLDTADQHFKAYHPANVDRKKAAAFWDMEHTTGSDLKVHPKTRAILTVNRYSSIRDLMQAAWRLRELEINQSVVFAVSYEDMLIIAKTLNEYFNMNLVVDDKTTHVGFSEILLYMALNEATTLADLNFRSVKSAQKTLLVESVFDLLIDKGVKGLDLSDTFGAVKSFFDSPRENHPYERYGVPINEFAPLEFLKEEIDAIFGPKQDLFKAASFNIPKTLKRLRKNAVKGLKSKVWVPSKRQAVETEAELEIEMEVETQNEIETEVETKVEVHTVDPTFVKSKIPWLRDKLMTGTYFENLASKADLAKPVDPNNIQVYPTAKVDDLLVHGKKPVYDGFFDPDLLASLNLFPVFSELPNPKANLFIPFGPHQAAINEMMVVLDATDPDKDKIKIKSFILLNRDEAFEIGDWLISEVEGGKNELDPKYKVLIYEFGNGFIRHSHNCLDGGKDKLPGFEEKIQQDPRFIQLVAQAKYISGRISYENGEEDALKAWLKDRYISTTRYPIYDLFFTDILRYKDTTKEEFEHTDLIRWMRDPK